MPTALTGHVYSFKFRSTSLLNPFDSTLADRASGVQFVSGVSVTRGLLQDEVVVQFTWNGPQTDLDSLGVAIANQLSAGWIGTYVYTGQFTDTGGSGGITKTVGKAAIWVGAFVLIAAFLFAAGKGIGGGVVA